MRSATAGTTLLELVAATTLATLALAIAFPTVDRALDGVRVRTGAERAAQLLLRAQQHADRHRQPVLLRVDPSAGHLEAVRSDGNWQREIEFRSPLRMVEPTGSVAVILRPGSSLPPLKLALATRDSSARGFEVDPMSGRPRDWNGR